MIAESDLDLLHFRDFESLELLARQVVEGFITGLHRSPFNGFSVEFSEHRIYNPGESTRHIDWKLYARTDRLYTKRYEEETNLRCRLVLDSSPSMFYPQEHLDQLNPPAKMVFSTVASLALMNLFKRQRDAVGLTTFGAQNYQSAARSTYAHMRALQVELYKMLQSKGQPPAGASPISMTEQLHLMAEKIERRSLIIIFSDMYEMMENPEAFLEALQHLKHGKHEIMLFWTRDRKTEEDLDFEARPYKFIDLETGRSIMLNPRELQKAYREQYGAFAERLRQECLRYKIDLHEADVAEGYQSILQSFLIKRKKLH